MLGTLEVQVVRDHSGMNDSERSSIHRDPLSTRTLKLDSYVYLEIYMSCRHLCTHVYIYNVLAKGEHT